MNIKSFWKNLIVDDKSVVFVAFIISITFLSLLSLVSCEEKPKEQPVAIATQPPVQPQPVQPPQVYLPPDQLQVPQQPVIINQQPSAPVHDSTMQNMLLGGLLGHAIGSSSRGAIPAPVYQQPQVVRQTVVRKVYVQPSPKSTFRSSSSFRSSSFSRRR